MEPLSIDLLPHITNFLDEPAGDRFLVPVAYVDPKLAELKAAGFAPKKVVCAAASHVLEAISMALGTADKKARLDLALSTIFGTSERKAFETVLSVAGRGLRPLVVPSAVETVTHDKPEPLETEKDVRLRHLALGEYDKSLRMLAKLSGLKVHFHAEGGGIRPPFPEEPGVVRILTNSQPPGHTSARYVSLAFGMKVHEQGLAVLGNGPTKGRGTVVKDALGEPLVQIVGGTWYLLIPTLSHFNWQTSAVIFDRLIALAWKGARDAAARPAKTKPATRKAFIGTVSLWTSELPLLITADLLNIDRKIEDAQRDLADLVRRKKESLALLEGFKKSTFVAETRGRMPKDFAAIKKDPHVARLTLVEDGFHVETVPIEIEHGGRRYAMGAFTIRVAKRGTVSVWSEAPTHEDGIPHPHIAKEGGPCFGNATRAIADAAGEQRYADAVRYVLRWLIEGYTPAIAAVKIAEWPYVGESPEHYETRRLADKALAKADADAAAAGIRVRPVTAAASAAQPPPPEAAEPKADEPAEEASHAAVS